MKLKGNIPYRNFETTDIESLDSKWRVEFERELKENNFVRGGKSLVLFGEGAVQTHEQWAACLVLAGMPAFYTNPTDIIRRLRGQYIPRDTDDIRQQFDEAESIFITDFFGVNAKFNEETDLLTWYIDQAIRDGCVIVTATDHDRDTTGYYQIEPLAQLCDQNFEAIRGKKTKSKNKACDK